MSDSDLLTMPGRPAVRQPIVIVDVDDTVLPLLPQWLAKYNRDFGQDLQPTQVFDFDVRKSVIPEAHDQIFRYLHDQDLYDGIEPIEGALAGVEAIREMGCRVVFVTSCNADMAGLKYRKLQEFGFLDPNVEVSADYIEASDKALIAGDIIIDGRLETVVSWVKTVRRAVLFDQPHNSLSWEKPFESDERYALLQHLKEIRDTNGLPIMLRAQASARTERAALPSGVVEAGRHGQVRQTGKWEDVVRHVRALLQYDQLAMAQSVAEERVSSGRTEMEQGSGETILQYAQRLVYGDRQASYGHPFNDYERTGRIAGAIFDGWLHQQPGFEDVPRVPDIDPRIMCLFMVGVKVSRETNKPKADNRTDGAGYFACADRVARYQAGDRES